MKCRHLTRTGHCAEIADRPLHVANLTRLTTRCARVEYLEALDSAEGRMAGMLVRAEYLAWGERRSNAAETSPEAAGGAQTAAQLPADTSNEKMAQKAGNLEQGN